MACFQNVVFGIYSRFDAIYVCMIFSGKVYRFYGEGLELFLAKCFWKAWFYWPTQFCFAPLQVLDSRALVATRNPAVFWQNSQSRTHPRVFHLSNCIFKASELCKWLRHTHVTANMPSFGTGYVIGSHFTYLMTLFLNLLLKFLLIEYHLLLSLRIYS